MILHPVDSGFVAIPPPARALLAFQIAAHWGNRTTPRPCARAEVLAAVLAGAVGLAGTEPQCVQARRPLTPDSVTGAEHEAIWTAAVARAASQSRYVAYLVSHHVSDCAAVSQATHEEFLRGEEQRRTHLREELVRDPRYAFALAPDTDFVNRGVVRLADALAALLARGVSSAAALPDLPQRRGPVQLTIVPVGAYVLRLQPWPLAGRRLIVHAEGRLLPGDRAVDQAALSVAEEAGTTVRLSWTLLSAAAD
jgi:hypothetical protein